MALVNKGAAIHIPDIKAKEELLPTTIAIVNDDNKLKTLSENIRDLAKPNAAQVIAEEVLILADAYIEKEIRRKNENIK